MLHLWILSQLTTLPFSFLLSGLQITSDTTRQLPTHVIIIIIFFCIYFYGHPVFCIFYHSNVSNISFLIT